MNLNRKNGIKNFTFQVEKSFFGFHNFVLKSENKIWWIEKIILMEIVFVTAKRPY